MLSLDFEDIAIIEIIATAKIMAAIVPNSGTTKVTIISICSAPAGNAMVSILSVYEITGGKILSIIPHVDANSLIISIDATDDGSLTLTIPRSVLDALFENGDDDDFFVLVDDEEVDFDEVTSETDRILTIAFPAGAEQIEIIGTFVVPEFGTIAAMILAVAIISIIAISAKSRLSIIPRF